MSEFRMPSLGADMEAGTLVEWMKQPGDRLQRGDAIAAVETQKGAIEIQTYEAGVLERILVGIGERVPVGAALAIIRGEGEGEAVLEPVALASPPAAAPVAPPIEAAPLPRPVTAEIAPAQPPMAAIAKVAPPAPSPGARISPAALRRAQELGLDLSALHPAVDGVVGLREVEAARASSIAIVAGVPPPAAKKPAPAVPEPFAAPPPPLQPSPIAARPGLDLDEMRKAIAAAMARSWREIPHYFVSSTLDLTPMLAWLERNNAQRPVPDRLHYAAPLIKAVALALKAVPVLNGHHGEHGFEPATSVHLGIAVAMRGGGLIAPAILDADTLALADVMAALNDLIARVRGGRLRSGEMTASTATLTNLGEGTADAVQPVIYPPQVAIIGCGQVIERAWAHDGALSARRTMTVSVGGDHRVSDGRSAAKFLARLDELLQHPERL